MLLFIFREKLEMELKNLFYMLDFLFCLGEFKQISLIKKKVRNFYKEN